MVVDTVVDIVNYIVKDMNLPSVTGPLGINIATDILLTMKRYLFDST